MAMTAMANGRVRIKPADIAYDVEIYDMQRLVYAAKQVPQSSHTVAEELPCKTLRWSVRPSYRVADGTSSASGCDTALKRITRKRTRVDGPLKPPRIFRISHR